MATLYLVRGCPGTGKTTFANTAFPGIPKYENDMFFMHDGKYEYSKDLMPDAICWCHTHVEDCLSHGLDCVVSNTFTRKRFVDSYKSLASKYDADFKVYRMMGEFENVHDVPENVLKNMKDNFDAYEGEMFVYPNINQSKDDPCYRPYMLTNLKVGDKIETVTYEMSNGRLDFNHERKCIATVEKITQGSYDYLNVHFVEDETGEKGLCMSGDCKRHEQKET